MNGDPLGWSRESSDRLPILTNCEGCGACCLEQGAPPDYVALRLNPHLADDPSFAEDVERLSELAGEAAGLLDQYVQESGAGIRPQYGPCVWFDAGTKSCRFYDWRPSTCRVFELGSPGCRIYRGRHGIEELCGTGS